MPCVVSAEVPLVSIVCLGRSPPCAQCLTASVAAAAAAAVLGAASESLHSSSTVCAPAPAPVWRSPPQQGLAVPLQHRLCQDDCIRPVRRLPVKDLP